MSRFQVFKKVYDHFIIENNPPSFRLQHRDDTGGRDVYGVLIPDDMYNSSLEGSSPDLLVELTGCSDKEFVFILKSALERCVMLSIDLPANQRTRRFQALFYRELYVIAERYVIPVPGEE